MILLSPAHLPSLTRTDPGTFPALMDLYECNYINIRRLIPVMPKKPAALVSQIPDGLALHFRLLERFRYTSEMHLTYWFDDGDTGFAEPDLRIRVYHDARMAEVLNGQLRHLPAFDAESLHGQAPNGVSLYQRWKINRFLFKWLNYCLRQGHRFQQTPPLSSLNPPPALKI
ncbi:MAG: DUF1249 domain-containing protein [Candidatus Competibacteraceae bacterium]|nr:DUF1249 domain-containing protein [Candidatus Competibacteraceae bacterium]